jgi:hypothetical protein
MKQLFIFTLILTALCLTSSLPQSPALAQQTKTASAAQAVDAERIVSALKTKEREFRKALSNYGFRREAVMQTIGMGRQISGEYYRVSHLTFDSQGKLQERIIKFPIPGLPIAPEDLVDLDTIHIFAVEAEKMDQYYFKYVGKERVDELDTYIFDVGPKVMPAARPNGERFFQGRIWVDDRDMQIVKARGKGVPEGKQRFPTFDYYREQVDGRYWFPSYTYADEDLMLPNGNVYRIKMRIRFTDHERTGGNAKATEKGQP